MSICATGARENLERLAAALRELKPTLRGAPPDLPFKIVAQSLALGSNFMFSISLGDLDLLGFVEPLGGYEEIAANAPVEQLGDVSVKVIALDDLIRVMRHINRPKDRESLFQLEAIKRIREETGG